MNLKKFKPKSLEVIKAQCMVQGLVCNSGWYKAGNSEFIVVFSPLAPAAKVFYAPINGRFFGNTDAGVAFESNKPLDNQPWSAALLDFFHEALPEEPETELAAGDLLPGQAAANEPATVSA